MNVERDVDVVVPQWRGGHAVYGAVEFFAVLLDQTHLPESWEVVESGEGDDEDDVEASSAVGTEGSRLKGMTHSHETFQGHREGQVHGHSLRDHG